MYEHCYSVMSHRWCSDSAPARRKPCSIPGEGRGSYNFPKTVPAWPMASPAVVAAARHATVEDAEEEHHHHHGASDSEDSSEEVSVGEGGKNFFASPAAFMKRLKGKTAEPHDTRVQILSTRHVDLHYHRTVRQMVRPQVWPLGSPSSSPSIALCTLMFPMHPSSF